MRQLIKEVLIHIMEGNTSLQYIILRSWFCWFLSKFSIMNSKGSCSLTSLKVSSYVLFGWGSNTGKGISLSSGGLIYFAWCSMFHSPFLELLVGIHLWRYCPPYLVLCGTTINRAILKHWQPIRAVRFIYSNHQHLFHISCNRTSVNHSSSW